MKSTLTGVLIYKTADMQQLMTLSAVIMTHSKIVKKFFLLWVCIVLEVKIIWSFCVLAKLIETLTVEHIPMTGGRTMQIILFGFPKKRSNEAEASNKCDESCRIDIERFACFTMGVCRNLMSIAIVNRMTNTKTPVRTNTLIPKSSFIRRYSSLYGSKHWVCSLFVVRGYLQGTQPVLPGIFLKVSGEHFLQYQP